MILLIRSFCLKVWKILSLLLFLFIRNVVNCYLFRRFNFIGRKGHDRQEAYKRTKANHFVKTKAETDTKRKKV